MACASFVNNKRTDTISSTKGFIDVIEWICKMDDHVEGIKIGHASIFGSLSQVVTGCQSFTQRKIIQNEEK